MGKQPHLAKLDSSFYVFLIDTNIDKIIIFIKYCTYLFKITKFNFLIFNLFITIDGFLIIIFNLFITIL